MNKSLFHGFPWLPGSWVGGFGASAVSTSMLSDMRCAAPVRGAVAVGAQWKASHPCQTWLSLVILHKVINTLKMQRPKNRSFSWKGICGWWLDIWKMWTLFDSWNLMCSQPKHRALYCVECIGNRKSSSKLGLPWILQTICQGLFKWLTSHCS